MFAVRPSSTKTWKTSLLTPMMGGGILTGDPDEPFRTTTVRSQIRWWWRQLLIAELSAAELGAVDLVTQLRCQEEELWGFATDKAKSRGPGSSQVQVCGKVEGSWPLRTVNETNFLRDVTYGWKLTEDLRVRANTPHVLKEASCEISIDGVPAGDDKVWLAVDLWRAFGAVGMRGRRGFGSLTQCPLSVQDIELIWKKRFASAPPIGWAGSTLAGSTLFIGPKMGDAIDTWKEALDTYVAFRKGNLLSAGRRNHRGIEAHSRWPESDSLRRAQNPGATVNHWYRGGQIVPRADLGLPLSLKSAGGHWFRDDALEMKDNARWPSPVITKAAELAGEVHPVILVLRSPGPPANQLKWHGTDGGGFNTDCTNWPHEFFDRGFSKPVFHGSLASAKFVDFLRGKLPKNWTKIS